MLLGWQKMKRILPCNILLLLLYGLEANSAEVSATEINNTEISAQQNQQALPSILFLEYLADMTEVDGQLIGPQDISTSLCKLVKPKQKKNEDKSENEEQDNAVPNSSTQSPVEKECTNHD